MTKKTLALLGFSVLLFAGCTPNEQQAINDVLDDENRQEEQGDMNEEEDMVNAEMDAWAQQDQQPVPEDNIGEDNELMEKEEETQPAQKDGQYTGYNASVLANGETKVLFFHASWCPVCKAADTELQAWYGQGGIPLSVYKVNYDAEVELKQKYGITYQHTFVKVDGQGNLIEKIQGPTDAQLKTMLEA